jgi:carboxyl-terminal processing protease
VGVGFGGAFLSGFFLKSYFVSQSNEFLLLNQATNIFTNHTYFELPELKSLEYGMIRGMLQASGDPFATFLEPVQHELETNNLQGSFGGIGVELNHNDKGDVLIYPIVDGPAYNAGIQEGDQLISVGDLTITQFMPLDDIHAALRGPIGDKVKVSVIREVNSSPLEFQIKRERIHLPSVSWYIDPDNLTIGIIRVNVIADSTPDEIQEAILDMGKKGATHYVLDLRDNGGGLLTAGVDTARLFLKDGVVIEQQYRGDEVETFDVKKPGSLQDIPIIILVNHSTASAAEIIAGSLQAHNRALLVGETTFGKDTIQLVFDLDDDSSLHVTAAKWWIPGLYPPVGENGLQPEIAISPGEDGSDLILEGAIQSLIDQ